MPPGLLARGAAGDRVGHAAAAHAVRVLGLLSVGLVWWGVDAIAASAMALALGGQMLCGLVGMRPPADAAAQAVLLAAGWFAALDTYSAAPGLDLLLHVAATGVGTWLAWVLFHRTGALRSPLPGERATRWGLVLALTGIGTVLGVLWELGEWFGHTYLDDQIRVGYEDTLGDLAGGLLGAAAAGWVAARGDPPKERG